MSLTKIFTVSFVLGGIVSSAFSSTMSRGISRLQQLGQQEEKLKDKQKQLTASHAEAVNELQQYQGKLSSLQERHNSCCMTYAQYNAELHNITENISRATANSRRYAGELQQVQRQLERTARIKKATENFDNSKAELSDAVTSFGKTASAIGMLVAPLAGAVKYSMDFNAAMSKVKAITGATAEDMKKLTEQAELMGRTTPYTATQSAEAMTYLGMAGWNTTQIMAGMPSMLNLATASGSDLATVADILSDDLTAFGMSAEQAKEVSTVIREIRVAEKEPVYVIQTTGENAKGESEKAVQQEQADFAIVTDKNNPEQEVSLEDLDKDTKVELNQYNVQAFKKHINTIEYQPTEKVIGYTHQWKVTDSGRYMGVGADYDIDDRKIYAKITYSW